MTFVINNAPVINSSSIRIELNIKDGMDVEHTIYSTVSLQVRKLVQSNQLISTVNTSRSIRSHKLLCLLYTSFYSTLFITIVLVTDSTRGLESIVQTCCVVNEMKLDLVNTLICLTGIMCQPNSHRHR